MSFGHDERLGTVIDGRYELLDVVGQGGYGVVYKALQIATGQHVAIKVLLPERLHSARRRMTEMERFKREMKLIGQISHPNIVRLIDSGDLEDGQLYLVLEYIEGVPLSQLLNDGPLPITQAVRLMCQVLEGLRVAHKKGVVHRDLKPHNVMVVEPGPHCSAMVLDFGIAYVDKSARDQDYRSLTAGAGIAGTPAYMAPEQLLDGSITAATDLYAWGLVFLECLTGRVAIAEDSLVKIILRHSTTRPVDVPAELAGSALERVLRRATAATLADRYDSAEQALEDLALVDVRSAEMQHTSERLANAASEEPRESGRPQATADSDLAHDHTVDSVSSGPIRTALSGSEPLTRNFGPTSNPDGLVDDIKDVDRSDGSDDFEAVNNGGGDRDSAARESEALSSASGVHGRPEPTLNDDEPAPLGAELAQLNALISASKQAAPPSSAEQEFRPPLALSRTPTKQSRAVYIALIALAVIGGTVSIWAATSSQSSDEDQPVPTAPTPEHGTLLVEDIRPENARIIVNDQLVGVAPGLFEVPLGDLEVYLLADDHEPYQRTVMLSERTPQAEIMRIVLTPWVREPDPMVAIPGGSFTMGCVAEVDSFHCERDELPVREVTVADFEIDVYEVTVEAYGTCVLMRICDEPIESHGLRHRTCNYGHPERQDHPVNCVTWHQAQIYCEWVQRRLPTEAEWERAARGDDERTFPWGEEAADCTRAAMTTGDPGCEAVSTSPVGTHSAGASPYAVQDMSGNVNEWLADWYNRDYYEHAPSHNPVGPLSATERSTRGGGWDDDPEEMRLSRRGSDPVWEPDDDLGFRCARSL